ncbi:hypothetical protein V5O48_008043 [Marasmius crinis-equi]|uniref:Protein kinase domain-containing protein n=1 Tax=Marasmius crinis-equi TaxID=585013 RepID=A0ABR3FF38_9AGAR
MLIYKLQPATARTSLDVGRLRVDRIPENQFCPGKECEHMEEVYEKMSRKVVLNANDPFVQRLFELWQEVIIDVEDVDPVQDFSTYFVFESAHPPPQSTRPITSLELIHYIHVLQIFRTITPSTYKQSGASSFVAEFLLAPYYSPVSRRSDRYQRYAGTQWDIPIILQTSGQGSGRRVKYIPKSDVRLDVLVSEGCAVPIMFGEIDSRDGLRDRERLFLHGKVISEMLEKLVDGGVPLGTFYHQDGMIHLHPFCSKPHTEDPGYQEGQTYYGCRSYTSSPLAIFQYLFHLNNYGVWYLDPLADRMRDRRVRIKKSIDQSKADLARRLPTRNTQNPMPVFDIMSTHGPSASGSTSGSSGEEDAPGSGAESRLYPSELAVSTSGTGRDAEGQVKEEVFEEIRLEESILFGIRDQLSMRGLLLERYSMLPQHLGVAKLDGRLVVLKVVGEESDEVDIHKRLLQGDGGPTGHSGVKHIIPLLSTIATSLGTVLVTPLRLSLPPPSSWCSIDPTGSLVAQLFDAVEYIHSCGIAHLDIRPANIVLDEDESRLELIDFGISLRVSDPDATTSGFRGDPDWVAPEVAGEGRFWPFKADLWAAGLVIQRYTEHIGGFMGERYHRAASHLLHQDPQYRHLHFAQQELLRRSNSALSLSPAET